LGGEISLLPEYFGNVPEYFVFRVKFGQKTAKNNKIPATVVSGISGRCQILRRKIRVVPNIREYSRDFILEYSRYDRQKFTYQEEYLDKQSKKYRNMIQ